MMYAVFGNNFMYKSNITPFTFYTKWTILLQLLLVQDGKLYGRDTFLAICARAVALDATRDHVLQKNEYILQLGQVRRWYIKN